MSQKDGLKKTLYIAILIAVGFVLSPILSIPLGFAKAYPVQHMLNVLIAVFFGLSYNVSAAFSLSTIRILMGTGTVLAYPGSLFGAFLSAFLYKQTGSIWLACIGEVIGTGIIGGYVAYLVATFVLGSKVGAMALIIPFAASSATGALLAGLIVAFMRKSSVFSMRMFTGQ